MDTHYEPTAGAYILNRIFRFPTDNGTARAVAVSAANASSILSIYSILINTAVGQVWAIIIIIGVYATLRQPAESRSHNAVVASVGVLNAKRPLEVSTLTFNYLWKLRSKSPWSTLLWLLCSPFALLASAGIPALIGRSMVLGHGAPVNPDSIYVPGTLNITTESSFILNTLQLPSALRAAGSMQSTVGSIYDKHIQIDDPVKLSDRPDIGAGEYTTQYGYRYQVTAKDFGLQRYDGLALHVEGACATEYGWQYNSSTKDGYCLWGDCTQTVNISALNSPMPMAVFKMKDLTDINDWPQSNTSFAIVISSAGRISFSPGVDPFYLTGPNRRLQDKYEVKKGRPVLSCWQADQWIYKNQHFAVTRLSSDNSTLPGFPDALNRIFTWYLSTPKIMTLGNQLGQSALFSVSRSSIWRYFDAGRASVHLDLEHLVYASYIATKNTLTDTTLTRADNTSSRPLPSIIKKEELKDVAVFVLYSKDISALSLEVLISVPIVVVVMFLIAYIITSHPFFPWHVVQGYQATILYSLLDEKLSETERPPSEDGDKNQDNSKPTWWRRESIAWFEGPRSAGRHASTVTEADGRPTLLVADRAGTPTPGQVPNERNETVTLLGKGNERTSVVATV